MSEITIPTTIHSLPIAKSSATSSAPPRSLKEEIEAGLIGTSDPVVPGSEPEDLKWSFKRSVPTLVLYDEQGLRLYDRITSEAPEYYLFPDELDLLKTYGDEIARSMGFPGSTSRDFPRREEHDHDRDHDDDANHQPVKAWKPARWGDVDVGKWNGGVNGEEGIGGGWQTGWDIVELGAGALRKTAHLLTALSSALPAPPSNAESLPAPITYHPLDLSYPELDRVLGQMDQAFGSQLSGKVACVDLHGDNENGLQFIRDGKLETLRPRPAETLEQASRGRQMQSMSRKMDRPDVDWLTPATPENALQALDPSPSFSPSSTVLVTPGARTSPPPSAITDDGSTTDSDTRARSSSASGTWSSIEDDDPLIDSSGSKSPKTPSSTRPLHLVFLGSSLGNFPREAAAPFLKSMPLKEGDTFLIGLDGRPEAGPEGRKKVEIAYNDPAGHTRLFEEHGWDVVRQELSLKDDAGVEFVGRYNEKLGRHEAYFRSKERQTIKLPSSDREITLEKDELLNIEWSYKYSQSEALDLFNHADLRVINSWKAPNSEYRLWLLERPHVRFDMTPRPVITSPPSIDNKQEGQGRDQVVEAGHLTKNFPRLQDWLAAWKLWDHITLEMIPKKMLHQKPIDLRHICLFYLGHIPTFLDIHLTRLTKGSHTDPEHFKDIFERGIDPCVDDPTQIHPHSEVPSNEADWPSLDAIIGFRDRVRQRLRDIYSSLESGEMEFNRHVARVLFMTHEHEIMHAETLLYMLIQSASTRPPTSNALPQWDVLSRMWQKQVESSNLLTIENGSIEYGHDDLEAEDPKFTSKDQWANHEFGWDIENPKVASRYTTFKIETLPITNIDYLKFLGGQHAIDTLAEDNLPASWVKIGGDWKVRTLYGPVGLDVAGHWPLIASKVEIESYAKSKGGRLPTEVELRAFWAHPEGSRPAGHLANIGFKHWHPIPPANTKLDTDGSRLYGHNGGVWEWTDTPLKGLDGYVPSILYPGYSADFFDDRHYVVLGGSYATPPCIAARKSFRNFYQGNYRFAFIGGRVAYDA